MMKVVALISGGKDSCFNMMHVVAEGHNIVALANLHPASSKTDELDSYMYQTVGHEAINLYSEAMDVPLFRRKITGTSRTLTMDYEPDEKDEVEDLFSLLKDVKDKMDFDAVASGAILSDYQRIRVESVCCRLGVKSLSYLWRRDQKELLQEMIDSKLEAILIKTAALGLDPKKHLGQTLLNMQATLHELSGKYGCHICGEGGEFETFTLDCPLFKKRIVIDDSQVIIHSDDYFAPVGYLKLKAMHLEPKNDETIPQIECLPLMTSSKWKKKFMSKIENRRNVTELEDSIALPKVVWRVEQTTKEVTSEPQASQHGKYLVVSNIHARVTGPLDEEAIKDAAFGAFQKLEDVLSANSHNLTDACYIQLNVSDMSHYSTINKEYTKFFAKNPPARACIGCLKKPDASSSERLILQAYCISCLRPDVKRSMHVQGISHWAPANIGPFSQCVLVDQSMFVSGTIGLVPGSMDVINEDIATQASLALTHVESAISAMAPHTDVSHFLQCVCYVTRIQDVSAAKNSWETATAGKANNELCEPMYLVVNELPKGALAEWQGVAYSYSESSELYRHSGSSTIDNIEFHWTFVKATGNMYSCTCSLVIDGLNEHSPKICLQGMLQQLGSILEEHHLSTYNIIQTSLYFSGDGVSPEQLERIWTDLPGGPPSVTCIRADHIFGSGRTYCLSCVCLIQLKANVHK